MKTVILTWTHLHRHTIKLLNTNHKTHIDTYIQYSIPQMSNKALRYGNLASLGEIHKARWLPICAHLLVLVVVPHQLRWKLRAVVVEWISVPLRNFSSGYLESVQFSPQRFIQSCKLPHRTILLSESKSLVYIICFFQWKLALTIPKFSLLF